MLEDYQEQERKKVARVRSTADMTRGVLVILAGIFFLTYRFFGIRMFGREPSPIDFVIGGVFLLYGGWRVYRGIKKDYFR